MVQHERLVVAQIAHWVFTIVRIREEQRSQCFATTQIQHLLELANFVGGHVEFCQLQIVVQPGQDIFNAIGRQPQDTQFGALGKTFDLRNLILTQPQDFQLWQVV